MTMDHPVLQKWLADLKPALEDHPNYYASNPRSLINTSQPLRFNTGTGAHVLSFLLQSCLSTTSELILVTCFWAKSKSQQDICTLLRTLSAKALSSHRKIRVRICFSSISILQKVFGNAGVEGTVYKRGMWKSLGLPAWDELRGLEMTVKSVFVRPFSVMHPKFVIVDRRRAWFPSCNVSWEDWFEGAVEVRGEVAGGLFKFWTSFWGRGGNELPERVGDGLSETEFVEFDESQEAKSGLLSLTSFSSKAEAITTVLLPSPHHQNPRFYPFSDDTPSTPLNTFLLAILNHAEANSYIYVQTPNLTSRPFLNAIISALSRGVHIHIITSRRLMILEQLVTAGTFTEFEIWKLKRHHFKALQTYQSAAEQDAEFAIRRPGKLKIGYFQKGDGWQKGMPVKSHLKCVIVDDEITVLGSGNMDRASWYTSQELGVAFLSRDVARDVRRCIDEGLEGRVEYIC